MENSTYEKSAPRKYLRGARCHCADGLFFGVEYELHAVLCFLAIDGKQLGIAVLIDADDLLLQADALVHLGVLHNSILLQSKFLYDPVWALPHISRWPSRFLILFYAQD